MVKDMAYYSRKTHATVEIPKTTRDSLYATIRPHTLITRGRFNDTVWAMIERTAFDVTHDVTNWINRFVPKANGNLRRSLITSIDPAFSRNMYRWRFMAGSAMSHIRYVNEMAATSLRHSGGTRYIYYNSRNAHSRRYGHWVTLNDPQAVSYFYEKMIEYAVRIITTKMMNSIAITVRQMGIGGIITPRQILDQIRIINHGLVDSP